MQEHRANARLKGTWGEIAPEQLLDHVTIHLLYACDAVLDSALPNSQCHASEGCIDRYSVHENLSKQPGFELLLPKVSADK